MRFNIRVVQDSFDLMMHCRKCQRINIIMIHPQETMKLCVRVHGNQLITSRVHPVGSTHDLTDA